MKTTGRGDLCTADTVLKNKQDLRYLNKTVKTLKISNFKTKFHKSSLKVNFPKSKFT